GLQCLHLSLEDARHVVTDSALLDEALDTGRVSTYPDIRTGEPLVRPQDLRAAGLLIEPSTAHGIAASTAKNVLRDLKLSFTRARDHGADLSLSVDLTVVEPLPDKRQRDNRAKPEYVSLQQTRTVAGELPLIGQVVLWMGRLLGLRISEVYGPRVKDLTTDEHGRAWLTVASQGGTRSLERDPQTGLLVE